MMGYHKDIIKKYAMHIFKNLEFKPMNALTRDEQFQIKEALLEIYVESATCEEDKAVRTRALEAFRRAYKK